MCSLVIDGRRSPRGTDRHDAVHTRLDLNFYQAFEGVFINFAVLNGVTIAV